MWKGSAFGGIKGRSQLPGLVDDYMSGKLKVEDFISHTRKFDQINEAFSLLKDGECIRCVVDVKGE